MHLTYRLELKNIKSFASVFSYRTRISRLPFQLSILAFLTLITNGCSVLVGNVKPVDEKSERYTVINLEKTNPDWKALPSQSVKSSNEDSSQENIEGSSTDVAFQSKKTASIISLNSSCRKANLRKDLNLQDYSKVLLLGLTEINDYNEKEVQLAGFPAFETITDGKMPLDQPERQVHGLQKVRLKTFVVKKEDCLYDLMYIAKPEHFSSQESDFNLFVQSLKIK